MRRSSRTGSFPNRWCSGAGEYENARYPDARAALAEFQQRYQAMHDGPRADARGLADAAGRIRPPDAGPVGLQQVVPPAAREQVAQIEQDGDIRGALLAAVQLAQEIDSIDRRPEGFPRLRPDRPPGAARPAGAAYGC